MNKIKCTLPRRGFNARSRGTSMKYEEKEYLNVTCNRLVYSLSSVSPVRKQRDREEFLLTLIKAEPYTFLYYVGPEPKNPRKCKETRILRRNSRPRSSFEIGPKESRIEATDRKTKLSLTLAVLFVFSLLLFLLRRFLSFPSTTLYDCVFNYYSSTFSPPSSPPSHLLSFFLNRCHLLCSFHCHLFSVLFLSKKLDV